MDSTCPTRLPSRDDIEAAARRLAALVRRTPVLEVDPGDLGLSRRRAPLVLKLELLQLRRVLQGAGRPRPVAGG